MKKKIKPRDVPKPKAALKQAFSRTSSSSQTIKLTVDPEAFKAQLKTTPFREYLANDNKRKAEDVDGRTSQEKQIALLMDQLAEAKTGTAAALDQVRLEESGKTIEALTSMNTRLLNIVELLATGIAKP